MLRKISLFGLVGVFATATHMLVGGTLIALDAVPYIANGAGFASAFLVSFIGHRQFTFAAGSARRRRSFGRFFVVSVAAFSTNQGLLVFLVDVLEVYPIAGLVASTGTVACITFFAARAWIFRPV